MKQDVIHIYRTTLNSYVVCAREFYRKFRKILQRVPKEQLTGVPPNTAIFSRKLEMLYMSQ